MNAPQNTGPKAASRAELSPEQIEALERQVFEATKKPPLPWWLIVLDIAGLIIGILNLFWGNTVFGTLTMVSGNFFKWLYYKFH